MGLTGQNKKMKLLFLIPTMGAGGMERVMSELLSYGSQFSKYEIHLLLYGNNNVKTFYELPQEIKIHKPRFNYKKKNRFLYMIKICFLIRKKFKEISPDTSLSFGEKWNNLVLLSTVGLKYPIFISDRSKPSKNIGVLHSLLRKLMYKKAEGCIAQTQTAQKHLQNKLNLNNIAVIGNPIRPIPSSSKLRTNTIISVGRLIRTKHFDRLVNIFAQCKLDNWKLLLIGLEDNGSLLLNDLKKNINSLGISSKVDILGKVDNVEEYLLSSRIFAFTSSSEGFPNVLGEAMQASLPIVAYDCEAGPSDLIKNNITGYLVDLYDDENFQNKLSQLTGNSQKCSEMGDRGKAYVEKFSRNKICSQYFDFITKIKKSR